MKKYYLFLTLAAVMLVMSSCGDSPDSISGRKVKKLYNKQLKEACANQVFTQIDTGYYELNSASDRATLKRLEAAGLITYSVERYAWYNKVTSKQRVAHNVDYYYTWTGAYAYTKKEYSTKTRTGYELEEHFMVNVQLTDAGRKIAVDSLPEPLSKEDKDLVLPEYVAADWPEDSIDVTEDWPVIPYPVEDTKNNKNNKAVANNNNNTDNKVADNKIDENANDSKIDEKADNSKPKDNDGVVCLDPETKARYEAEKDKEYKEAAYLKAFNIVVAKVRNIQIVEKDGATKAKAEVIIKTKDVTHAGHIMYNGVINDMPKKQDVNLTYYLDKGWVLDEEKTDKSDASDPSSGGEEKPEL